MGIGIGFGLALGQGPLEMGIEMTRKIHLAGWVSSGCVISCKVLNESKLISKGSESKARERNQLSKAKAAANNLQPDGNKVEENNEANREMKKKMCIKKRKQNKIKISFCPYKHFDVFFFFGFCFCLVVLLTSFVLTGVLHIARFEVWKFN